MDEFATAEFETGGLRMSAVFTERGLARLALPGSTDPRGKAWARAHLPDAREVEPDKRAEALRAQLDDYFAGKLRDFDVPLDLRGTEFQRKVWQALLRIPFGATRSYQQVAKDIGQPKAMRAVGGANHANPVVIVVPCHRVIGAGGDLTGYGGGGLPMKRKLLGLESEAIERTRD